MAGAMDAVQGSDLPPWAWTLGLSQPEVLLLVQSALPALKEMESMTEAQYATLLKALPEDFKALAGSIAAEASTRLHERHARCLALALGLSMAAACSEAHALRRELDLPHRPALRQLLQQYFAGLAAACATRVS
ncbi:nitrogen fixation protein NifQ [Azohydromonas australica]|uniref:nitrogen fixation protein NifQ n=1 Tax=Azohydromonas australica TaxID=364039 RepID=UPI00040C9680|nr:nitrogen fixation protein NifQ [Azohydromonas australica]